MNDRPLEPVEIGSEGGGWIRHPGRSGAFGALIDEAARAAEDFARTVESLPQPVFENERPSDDPDTVSIRAICTHVIGAAYRHCNYIRRARGMQVIDPVSEELCRPATPAAVRGLLRDALLYMEEGLDGLSALPETSLAAMTFPVRWGPTYDPEMMMEHAVVHLLRHRRQIARWRVAAEAAPPRQEES
jgi:hypothetical protein